MAIGADIGHLVRDDEVMLRLDRCLHVVTDDACALALARHGTRVWIGEGHLTVWCCFHTGFEPFQPTHLVLERRDPLFQPCGVLWRAHGLATIHPIELPNVLSDVLLD